MSKMVKRVPVVSVVVQRVGKRVECEIGVPFEFTEEEADRLERRGSVSTVATVHADDAPVKEAPAKGKKAAATKEAEEDI